MVNAPSSLFLHTIPIQNYLRLDQLLGIGIFTGHGLLSYTFKLPTLGIINVPSLAFFWISLNYNVT